MKFSLLSKSPEDTFSAGLSFSSILFEGMLVLLDADVGGGKTTFMKGVMNDREGGIVSSPTFTIINEYSHSKGVVRHIDLYRLEDVEMILRTIDEYHDQSNGMSFIEWPSVAKDRIQEFDVRITFRYTEDDEMHREVVFESGSKMGENALEVLAEHIG